jgi:hypothetical protein
MADPKLEKQLETYFTKGDSLYSIFADPSTPVFEKEGEYPDIPLFTEKGEWSPEWDERGLSDVSREGNVISGINVEGEPVRRTINRSTWGAPSRQQYLSGKMGALDEDLPWEVQKDLRSAALSYGFHDKPKYSSKGNVISPFQMLQFHREKTKGMDPFEEMSFDRDYRNMLEHMPTEKPTIDDKAFDLMKKGANE